MKAQEYNAKKAHDEQERFCSSKELPRFAPYDGVCYRCHSNIYSPKVAYAFDGTVYTTGFDVERAGKMLITGCPHCNASFCD